MLSEQEIREMYRIHMEEHQDALKSCDFDRSEHFLNLANVLKWVLSDGPSTDEGAPIADIVNRPRPVPAGDESTSRTGTLPMMVVAWNENAIPFQDRWVR
jgi:hypothetical protein